MQQVKILGAARQNESALVLTEHVDKHAGTFQNIESLNIATECGSG
jgi:hypothetical protein